MFDLKKAEMQILKNNKQPNHTWFNPYFNFNTASPPS